MVRRLTANEKRAAKRFWPRMNVNSIWVSGEKTRRYNCLAWTLGNTSSWVWPWGSRDATKSEFDDLYRRFGYRPSGSGSIAAFGANLNAMKHAAISGSGHGARWESKCGPWLRIQHGLGEMEGGTYGNVKGFYSKGRGILSAMDEDLTTEETELAETEEDMLEALSKDELAYISKKAKQTPKRLQTNFNSAYNAWKATWDDPAVMVSSNPGDRARSVEFLNLIALGPEILPLIMEKLADPDEFFTLQAVERLVRPELFESADLELDDPRILGGEQERARTVLKRWLALEL